VKNWVILAWEMGEKLVGTGSYRVVTQVACGHFGSECGPMWKILDPLWKGRMVWRQASTKALTLASGDRRG